MAENVKDMKTVADYNREQQLKIFRGQCLNNACVLLGNYLAGGKKDIVSISDIYDYAQQLYDEGIKRDWINYGLEPDNRSIDKSSGQVVDKVPVIMTEEEGRAMDPNQQKTEPKVEV